MATKPESAKGLSLVHVAKLLRVPPRQVQYLREQDVLIPSVVGIGRGGRCYYSFDDIFLAYLLLLKVPFLKAEGKKKVVESIRTYPDRNGIEVGADVVIQIDLAFVREEVTRCYETYVDGLMKEAG